MLNVMGECEVTWMPFEFEDHSSSKGVGVLTYQARHLSTMRNNIVVAIGISSSGKS